MLNEGKHKATIEGYGIVEHKKKNQETGEEEFFPCLVVCFAITDDKNQTHDLTWNGWTSSKKAIEMTFKALKEMEFSGRTFAELADENKSVLNMTKEITVTVYHEEWNKKDSNGVETGEVGTVAKISFIGDGGYDPLERKIDKAGFRKFKSLNLDGAWNSFDKGKKEVKKDIKKENVKKENVDTDFNANDIPF